ncbi:DEAD-domain-containing protein [Hesseltinella vesiculosa]|uniref:DEAD-domain-containing protein n=1 Tax=Hesseltinella vesiculosa TaxID=101127 RepID=A0A1X2G910_9FUNG|nr:DEAD-domain-containing protein [Hesseltinella vesiculosa]
MMLKPCAGALRSMQCCAFSTTSAALSKRAQLRKPNISTLTKHLKPHLQQDGLNGRQRREQLRRDLKATKPKSKNSPYVPVKRRLEQVPMTPALQGVPTIKVRELSAFLSQQSFDDLGLQPIALEALQKYLQPPADGSPIRPTEIQALAIPTLLNRNKTPSALCAAETGSGKTLAYLLPVLHQLKADEKTVQRRLDHPRAVVLVPTRELVQQVAQTAKQLSHTIKFRCLGIDRVFRSKLTQQLATGPIDLLVATPTTLQHLVKDRVLSLSDTRYLVMDEADSLFDAGWANDCQTLLEAVQRKKDSKKSTAIAPPKQAAQVIVVSATLPRSVHATLDKLFPHMVKITTPSLHRALPNLKQSFVDLQRYQGNRQMALLEVLKKNIKDDKTLVFCNTKKAVDLVHDWLLSKDVKVLSLSKDSESRKDVLQRFANRESGDNILISTDIASRGIDTTFVDHVVLFDFPTSVVDYLHRVGRTARAGQVGKATSLIGRKDRMMADRIKRAIREGSVMT